MCAGDLHVVQAAPAAGHAVDDAGHVEGDEHVEEVGGGVEHVGVLGALARHEQHHGRKVDRRGGGVVGGRAIPSLGELGGAAKAGEHVAQVVAGELVGSKGRSPAAVGAECARGVAVPYCGWLAPVAGTRDEALDKV